MDKQMKITQPDLIGAWKLIEFKITQPDGMTKDWGACANGLLIYDSSGHMSTSINSGTDSSICAKELEKHVLFYAGTYKITKENEITHFVMNASNPDRIGKNFIRNATLTDKKYLQLTANGDYGHATLLWQKLN